MTAFTALALLAAAVLAHPLTVTLALLVAGTTAVAAWLWWRLIREVRRIDLHGCARCREADAHADADADSLRAAILARPDYRLWDEQRRMRGSA